MATRTRTPLQIEQDRARIATLVLQGREHAEIALELGVSRQQVTYDLKVIKDRWASRTTMDLDQAKADELVKIDRLERTYWDAWELQCTPQVYRAVDGDGNPILGGEEVQVPQTGDPKLLAGILSCIDRRCKLLGLDAPIKLDPGDLHFTITFDTPQKEGEILEHQPGSNGHTPALNGASH